MPAGAYLMGSTALDSSASPDEKPLHGLSLHAFWIDKTEVTNAAYASCVAAARCSAPLLTSSESRDNYYGNPQYDSFPVIWVTWSQALQFCEWVGGRLPTEAEWEKAARGGPDRKYPWGDQPSCTLANMGGCVGDTTATGAYPMGVSPYLLLDMAGNAGEWVSDWYSASYYELSPVSNPQGPATGTQRVVRGGSWFESILSARAAARASLDPLGARSDVGFRCADDVDPPSPTPTATATASATRTATATPTATATSTATPTASATPTPTVTASPDPTSTSSATPTASATMTASVTPTAAPSVTPTPSRTPLSTASPTATPWWVLRLPLIQAP